MALQYREDFGFGDDEEFQGYISERNDDLKEHFNSEMFGDVYVDNVASDYTGRIMINPVRNISVRGAHSRRTAVPCAVRTGL